MAKSAKIIFAVFVVAVLAVIAFVVFKNNTIAPSTIVGFPGEMLADCI